MLLKTAFDRGLVFTVGQSSTTGHTGIIWSGIHHKTSLYGGESRLVAFMNRSDLYIFQKGTFSLRQ